MSAIIPALKRRRGSLSHLLPPMLLTLLLLAAITLVSCQTTLRFAQDTRWVTHTHLVLADIAATRSDMEQAETGQRGYLLTGSPRYLAPYLTARQMLPTDLLTLRRLTGDNPEQQRRLDALTPLAGAKLDELQETVNLRQQGQADAALRVVQTDRGAALMEQIQALTAQMAEEENRLLARRIRAAETAGRTGQILVVAGVLLILALLALATVMGGQYQRERTENEAALRRSQEELEARVAERTADLKDAGYALRQREERFRFLADSMPQIVWTSRPDGVTDYYNQRWHEYTGLTLEETVTGGMESVVHSDDLQLITQGWLPAMASGSPYAFEYRLRRTDGVYRWHLGRVLPLCDDADQIVMWAGTGTDIDDYKQAQAALQHANGEAENRVALRTAELAAANRTLQADQARLSAVVALQNEVVNAALDVDKVMALAAGSAQTLTRAAGAVIELVEGDALIFHTATGEMAALAATRLPVASTLSGRCVQTGQTLHCVDSEADARVDRALCRRLGIRSMIVAPLRDAGENKGVLKVMSPETNAFTDQDAQTLEILSGLVSAALSRAAQFAAKQAALDLLGESEAQFRSVIASMQEGLTVQDKDGRILLCNAAAEAILGHSADDFLKQQDLWASWRIVGEGGADFPRALQPSQVALRTGQPQPFTVLGVCRPDKELIWLAVSAAPLFHIGETEPYAVVTTFSDITDRRTSEQRLMDYNVVLEFQKQEMEKANEQLAQANARLEALATLDGLTGLKNHRVFQERLAEEFNRATRYGTPLSLVMLDVDQFKQYNDTFGHPAGDEVLKAVADLLQTAVRECDYVARYGGEEFALILPLTDGEGAFVIAERCRAAIEAAAWDKRPITASFGVASLSLAMSGCAALLADADELLYVAKADGRNQVASARVVRTGTVSKLLLGEKVSA